MASAVARAYNGGRAVPPAGSMGRAPGQGVWGRNCKEYCLVLYHFSLIRLVQNL